MTERYSVNLNVSSLAFRFHVDLNVDASVVAVNWGPERQADENPIDRSALAVAERRMNAIVRDRDQVEAELKQERDDAVRLAELRGRSLTTCENERREALQQIELLQAEAASSNRVP